MSSLARDASRWPPEFSEFSVSIQGLRTGEPQPWPETFKECEKQVSALMGDVFEERRPLRNRHALSLMVEELVLQGHGPQLFSLFVSEIDSRISNILSRIYASLSPDLTFLHAIAEGWAAFRRALHVILQVFSYLERHYVAYSSEVSLVDVSESLWLNQQKCLGQQFEAVLLHTLLQAIQLHRSGDTTREHDVQVVTNMLSSLGIYHDIFEQRFLEASAEFYTKESAELSSALSVDAYSSHAERRLREEDGRASLFLVEASRQPLLDLVRFHLIGQHVDVLSAVPSLRSLAEARKTAELGRLYTLLSQVDKLDVLRLRFVEAVRDSGLHLLAQLQEPSEAEKKDGKELKGKEFTAQLFALKDAHEAAWFFAFNRNPQFSLGIKEAWEKFLNHDVEASRKVTRFLAKRCDSLLRETKSAGEDIEAELANVMVIFRYLDCKDYFEEFYRTDLCKRLLTGKSASDDAEKAMVQKLKDECGQQYTHKMESMFKDVHLSRQTMALFNADAASQEEVAKTGLVFDVATCAAGTWPQSASAEQMRLPAVAANLQQLFSTFYKAKHPGRNLSWISSLGACEVRATFTVNRPSNFVEAHLPTLSGSPMQVEDEQEDSSPVSSHAPRAWPDYVFKVSEPQAWILLLFNGRDSLTVQEIAEATALGPEELQRQLLALYVNKATRILLRQKDENEERYSVNFDFQSKLRRMQVSQIQLTSHPKEEIAKVEARVSQDRDHQIDACIVRIMKTRKELRHNLLIAEVSSQLSFKCDPAMLKKRIEALIHREYLKRDDADHSVYIYVA
uniref:Cullin homog, putative n=2 Tax=Neospora caninum (strain Liverpool) TaxID=572307 RepID=A0A0F7UQ10_NEOCL|nr:TPA: cullin homog, putative [Neospora caninum Liverpool]